MSLELASLRSCRCEMGGQYTKLQQHAPPNASPSEGSWPTSSRGIHQPAHTHARPVRTTAAEAFGDLTLAPVQKKLQMRPSLVQMNLTKTALVVAREQVILIQFLAHVVEGSYCPLLCTQAMVNHGVGTGEPKKTTKTVSGRLQSAKTKCLDQEFRNI